MSNRRKSKLLIKCQGPGCQKPAVTRRIYPYNAKGELEDTIIFVCVDHVAEVEIDIRRGIELHKRQAERGENNG